MAARFNHTHGCQSCGAHPDNPRNQTPKLFGCRDCKSFSCQKHLARPRACPRCNSKRLYVAVRYHAQSFKNKGGVGETGKKCFFGGGGGAPNPKNKERAEKAANVATEIVKGVGAGVVEALKVLSESNPKANLPRPEDGTTTQEDLHASTRMADGLNKEMFDDTPTEPEANFGLINENDPLHLLTLLADNTLTEAEFADATKKKPLFSTDSYIFAPSLYEAEKISTELRQYNDKNPQKLIVILALELDPSEPEVAKRFCTLLQDNPYLFGSIGINPKYAKKSHEAIDNHITKVLNSEEKIIALGPIGFDLHYSPHAAAEQGALLNLMADIATDFDLPIFLTENNAPEQLHNFATKATEHTFILTQPAPNMSPLPHIHHLITLHAQTEEHKVTYKNIIEKQSKKNILLASGQRSIIPEEKKDIHKEKHNFQRNTPELTLETLITINKFMNLNNVQNSHHILNTNFLKLFHPDFSGE